MTTDVATVEQPVDAQVVDAVEQRSVSVQFSDEQVAIVRDTVCKPKERPATEAELGLFLARCQRTGLDPLSGQIYAVFRWDNRAGQEKMTIQTGIDGFRLVAQRSREFAGSESAWCGPDGQWRDVWLERVNPSAARVVVRRLVQGHVVAQSAVATWAEYGDTRNVWKGKPAHMLAKCAEALALRKLFPAELSGLYTSDEMADADAEAAAIPAPAPAPPQLPPWAMTADGDALRAATVRALDAIVIPEDAHTEIGKALLQTVKAGTNGFLPEVAVTTLNAVADVAQAFGQDDQQATDAQAAADRDADPPGEPVDPSDVTDPEQQQILDAEAAPASGPAPHYQES